MASKNGFQFIGNLAADPKPIEVQDGQNGCALRIATNYKTKENGTKAEFHRVIVWNGQAKTSLQYLTKGRLVLVEGYVKNRSVETKSGDKVTVPEFVATEVQFLDRPKTDVADQPTE